MNLLKKGMKIRKCALLHSIHTFAGSPTEMQLPEKDVTVSFVSRPMTSPAEVKNANEDQWQKEKTGVNI